MKAIFLAACRHLLPETLHHETDLSNPDNVIFQVGRRHVVAVSSPTGINRSPDAGPTRRRRSPNRLNLGNDLPAASPT